MRILNGDNLQILKSLEGERFDLAELDGPYMAGLEGWDILTEHEYIQHYAERLTALRPLLQPWGVVFVFGYPEGCAEIKSWAHRTEFFNCLRWITWYKQWTMHSARKTETILVLNRGKLVTEKQMNIVSDFRKTIKDERKKKGLSIKDAFLQTGHDPKLSHKAGGFLWYENENAKLPTYPEYQRLKSFFGLPSQFDNIPSMASVSVPGITNIDYITVPTGDSIRLSDENTLHSKAPKLYIDLFSPFRSGEKQKALILYGGSGNAAIAAEALGYEVTVIEQDPKRCKLIEKRSSRLVKTWREKLSQGSLWGFPTLPAPDGGDSAPSQALSTPDMFTTFEHEQTPAPCG